jgi:aarF domain-containing kinase
MASPSSSVESARRKYAKLVANIDDAHYPLFQAAITGRAALEGATLSGEQPGQGRGSLIQLGENNAEEKKRMRNAMVQQEGLMVALFEILRNVPRRGASYLSFPLLRRPLRN